MIVGNISWGSKLIEVDEVDMEDALSTVIE